MLTKILVFIKEFGILIAIGLALYFGYQGIFGESGALKLIHDNAIRMEERQKLWELQDTQNREKLEATIAELKESLEKVESHRQHIGTTARVSYHPDMKGYTNEIDEQIEDFADLAADYGLSD